PEDGSDGKPGARLCFVHLLDVIRHNLDELFPGMTVLEVMPFRITRNASVEADDDEPPEDLAVFVEEGLRQRRFEPAVRPGRKQRRAGNPGEPRPTWPGPIVRSPEQDL